MMSSKAIFDLLNSSEDSCDKLGKRIDEGEIDESELIEIFNYYKDKNYTENEAVTIIKNVHIILQDIQSRRTDAYTYFSRIALNAAGNITGNESLNFKIFKALWMSQIKEDNTSFKETASFYGVHSIYSKLDSDTPKHYKKIFKKLTKHNKKFDIYYTFIKSIKNN